MSFLNTLVALSLAHLLVSGCRTPGRNFLTDNDTTVARASAPLPPCARGTRRHINVGFVDASEPGLGCVAQEFGCVDSEACPPPLALPACEEGERVVRPKNFRNLDHDELVCVEYETGCFAAAHCPSAEPQPACPRGKRIDIQTKIIPSAIKAGMSCVVTESRCVDAIACPFY